MLFPNFENYFSAPRISRYHHAVALSDQRAMELYKANLRLAQAFHPLLGILEVTLRNRINAVLSAHFNDPDWILNQMNGFMVSASIPPKNRTLKNNIKKSIDNIVKSGGTVSSGKIIAEQTFGFWTEFFENHYYKLLLGRPIQIFANLPTGANRKLVKDELLKIRLFRNRISHNEPICFLGGNVSFDQAKENHLSIISLLDWVHPDISAWVQPLDTIQAMIDAGNAI